MISLAELADPATWTALISLVLMEIVLGIDNVVFISVLTERLPASERGRVTRVGLALALVMRVALLFALSWVLGLTTPLFRLADHDFAGRHLILIAGGLFLVAKATREIHAEVEGEETAPRALAASGAGMVIAQIAMLDAVFSLDSVITAVGMVDEIWIMVAAVILSMGAMLAFAGTVSAFVARHPSAKILALAFLVLIGVTLVAEGLGQHIAKGYVYFAMGFSLVVELLHHRRRPRASQRPSGRPSAPPR